jgi:hypothetical protein
MNQNGIKDSGELLLVGVGFTLADRTSVRSTYKIDGIGEPIALEISQLAIIPCASTLQTPPHHPASTRRNWRGGYDSPHCVVVTEAAAYYLSFTY